MSEWGGRKVQELREMFRHTLPTPCGVCGQAVSADQDWVIGHTKSRAAHPELTWDLRNMRVEHRSPCSNSGGQAAVIERAKKQVLAEHGIFPVETDAPLAPLRPAHTYRPSEPLEIRSDLEWPAHTASAPDWLSDLLAVPGDASVPLAMTPVHPEATGSYGPEAIDWIERELKLRLRWWQRLAIVRQLEHKADGSLCWKYIVESCPRRAGKSVRLRSMALWRLAHADLFGETQLALHCGKDVAIVREIHRQAWSWATEREDWNVRKGVGQEEVTYGEHRWLVRSLESTYGYDLNLGCVDESWAVPVYVVDEALEPAMLERQSPQLLLTSTAHRKATSLMRKRIASALAQEDGETLLLLWGARPQDDHSDPDTWKAASPYWSEDRHKMIAAKYAKALAGETDIELDDSDPMAGFTSQYLNVWRLKEQAAKVTGSQLVSEAEWELLEDEIDGTPQAAAIESWFSEGVSLALAYGTTVHTTGYPDLPAAVAALKASGYTGTTTVGASLTADPALKGLRVRPGTGRTTAAVQDFARLLAEDALRHTGSEHLTDQVLLVRTQPAADGIRLVSKSRADAIKATVWAVTQARKPSTGKPRILVAN